MRYVTLATGSLLASVAGLAVVEATSCDLLDIFTLLKPFAADVEAVACIATSGYDMLPPTSTPTDEQLALICASSSCVSTFSSLDELDLPDCTIALLGGVNVKAIVDAVATACPEVTSSGSSVTTSVETTSVTTESATSAAQTATTETTETTTGPSAATETASAETEETDTTAPATVSTATTDATDTADSTPSPSSSETQEEDAVETTTTPATTNPTVDAATEAAGNSKNCDM